MIPNPPWEVGSTSMSHLTLACAGASLPHQMKFLITPSPECTFVGWDSNTPLNTMLRQIGPGLLPGSFLPTRACCGSKWWACFWGQTSFCQNWLRREGGSLPRCPDNEFPSLPVAIVGWPPLPKPRFFRSSWPRWRPICANWFWLPRLGRRALGHIAPCPCCWGFLWGIKLCRPQTFGL